MKRKYLYTILVVVIAIIINALLYNYNNKYHYDDIKGAYGVANYTNSQQDIHFLSDGWQLYLNEDEISSLDYKQSDYITGIYTPLDVNKAIYRLQIINDNPDDFYTFIIPEIFSEYSLYINGDLIHQQDYIQTQQINIIGEKRLDCVLIIKNQSHYYNGQVFPIIFGEPNAVLNMYNLQNYSHSFLVFISLLSSLIMIMTYIFTGREKKYLYASILSLFLTIYLSHYLIHHFIPVSSMLTYISEDISYYMTLFILVCYIYQFYCQKKLHKLFIICSTVGITICCLIPYLFTQINHLTYFIGLFLKIDIVLLLIYTLYKNQKFSLLYYSILYFIISYCFDFIYDFEPIYFGWNTEIAAILLLVAYNVDVIKRQIKLYKSYSILKVKSDSMIEYTHTKAHDLKAPVASMQGYIDLLHEELQPDEKTYIINKLEDKISVLTMRMTQLQNLEYETCLLNTEKINLKDFLYQIILEFQDQMINKKIRIETDLLDVEYNIDPYYFKIVVENLIMNAIEHTHESAIFIKLYKTQHTIQIDVINYGDIISTQQITHIFEQGFSTKGLSRGYGLHISNKIVELHHATLSVSSSIQNGTCFSITF